MKRGLFRVLILLLIVAIITFASILYVGIKHGRGFGSLVTMHSGVVKMQHGFKIFTRGLRNYVFRGIGIYQKKVEESAPEALEELEYERIERERLEELEEEKIAAEIEQQQKQELAGEQEEIMSEDVNNAVIKNEGKAL